MFLTLAHAATLALALTTGPKDDAVDLIDWRITQTQDQEAADEVTLLLRSISNGHGWSNTSRSYPMRSLRGLNTESLNAENRTLMGFTLASDAGRLDCEGAGKSGTASGECDFEPDRRFGDELEAMGIERPSDKHLFRLTLAGVTVSDVRAMQRWGYGQPDLNMVIGLAIHGVDDEYVSSLKKAKLEAKDLNQLMAFRIHGVDAEFVRSIRSVGPRYAKLTGDDLLGFRIHGVTPETISTMQAFDIGNLGPDDVVAFQIHGVTAEFIDGLRAMGGEFVRVDAEDLVRFAIHGVDGEFIKAIAEVGYADLSASTLVSFRIHGVTPAYVRSFRESGLAQPTPEKIIRMKIAGFDPERIDDR